MTPPESKNTMPNQNAEKPGTVEKQTLPPDQARQGEVVLKGSRQRTIFLVGLIGAVVLAALIGLAFA